jgi:pyrroline-5-carboxylate reductase
MTSREAPLWIVGCGAMAGAMVRGWRRAAALPAAIAVRPSGQSVDGVTVVTSIPDEGAPQTVLLGIKPQKLDEIVGLLEPRVGASTTVVSILAGVELESLRRRFPRAARIVRAMPNLPVADGMGVVALIGDGPLDDVVDWFAPLGLVLRCANEEEFAAIGALAGAGPAYVARFVAALASAGEGRGLDFAQAEAIALQTVLGTAQMAFAHGETMVEVARRVASPNGTTEAGLAVLDGDRALDRLIARTLDAAAARGRELAAAARG